VTPVEWIQPDRSVLKNTTPPRNRPGVPAMNKNNNAYGKQNGTVEDVNAGVAIIPETSTVKTSNDTAAS
jgi:hypothetical protein